jgi:hypothetical protein
VRQFVPCRTALIDFWNFPPDMGEMEGAGLIGASVGVSGDATRHEVTRGSERQCHGDPDLRPLPPFQPAPLSPWPALGRAGGDKTSVTSIAAPAGDAGGRRLSPGPTGQRRCSPSPGAGSAPSWGHRGTRSGVASPVPRGPLAASRSLRLRPRWGQGIGVRGPTNVQVAGQQRTRPRQVQAVTVDSVCPAALYEEGTRGPELLCGLPCATALM